MTFYENLVKSIGEKEASLLIESLNNEDTHAVLLNTFFISDEEFLSLFPHCAPHPVVKHAFIYDKNEYELGKSIYHELGYFYLQDPGAMVTASLLDYKENEIILDLCAAPGGKSIQASLLSKGKSVLISNDLSRKRAELITNNVERLGLRNIIVTNNDFSKIYQRYINYFDKIILDAPCSGSGMFRKNEETQIEWSINKVNKFAEIQKELILLAYKMLKPGGEMIYSTCSYSKEEDEEVVSYLLSNSDAKIMELPKIGYTNPNNPIGIRLMPHNFVGEGQYICKIQKPGEIKENKFNSQNKFKFLPSETANKDIKKFDNTYFFMDLGVDTKDLSLLRYGVKIGEYIKDVLHYDLHYARSYRDNNLDKVELSIEEVKSYLLGNTLNKKVDKGYVILTYKNNPIDIAKSDGQIIKNHYPKGLRKNFYLI